MWTRVSRKPNKVIEFTLEHDEMSWAGTEAMVAVAEWKGDELECWFSWSGPQTQCYAGHRKTDTKQQTYHSYPIGRRHIRRPVMDGRTGNNGDDCRAGCQKDWTAGQVAV